MVAPESEDHPNGQPDLWSPKSSQPPVSTISRSPAVFTTAVPQLGQKMAWNTFESWWILRPHWVASQLLALPTHPIPMTEQRPAWPAQFWGLWLTSTRIFPGRALSVMHFEIHPAPKTPSTNDWGPPMSFVLIEKKHAGGRPPRCKDVLNNKQNRMTTKHKMHTYYMYLYIYIDYI